MPTSYKSALMVSPADITVSTTAGYTVKFEAGKPKFVPSMAVRECLRYGAKEVNRIKNTEMELPGSGSGGEITSNVHAEIEPDTRDIEEIDISSEETSIRKDKTTEVIFTPTENKVRSAIKLLVQECDPDNFTAAGAVKIGSINGIVADVTVTSKIRDAVWSKMESNKEIPADWPDPLFEDVETDDSEAA